MRARVRVRKDDAPVFRLTDIEVEEVSIVDRAANKRKFLVTKADPAPAPAPSTTPPPVPTPTPTPAPDPGPKTEPMMRLSPEMKAELMKRIATALERVQALGALIGGAEEVAGMLEIPAELVTKVAELVSGISDGDVAKGELVIKGLPQFSSTRLTQLRDAYASLGAILDQVTPAPTPPPVPDPAPTPPAEEDDGLSKKLASLEEAVAKGLSQVATLVGKQGDAIAKQAARMDKIDAIDRVRPTTNSEPVEGDPVRKSIDDEDGNGGERWPSDMSSKDASKIKETFAA
jgi:hypothetical protein